MNPADREVLAVITGLLIAGSAAGIISLFNHHEPMEAVGLLDQDCRMLDYPEIVFPGETLNLCVMVINYNGRVEAYRVLYKFAQPPEAPTNETPLDSPALSEAILVVPSPGEASVAVQAPIPDWAEPGRNATLVFELYRLNTETMEWEYTGKYVYLRVEVEALGP